MTKVVGYCGFVALLVAALWLPVNVRFHYPYVIRDEPLHNPVKVVKVVGNVLMLADTREVEMDVEQDQDITNQLAQSEYMIDVESGEDGIVGIYARQNGWVCGTPWAQPICIPIFRDTVYRNRREIIGVGTIKGEGENGGGRP